MRKFDCNSFRITGNTNFKKKLTSFVSKSVLGNPAVKLNKWNNYQAYLCDNFWNKRKVAMRKFDCNSFRITGNTNFKKKLTSFLSKSVWGNSATKVKVATEIRRHRQPALKLSFFDCSLNDCYEWTRRNKIIHRNYFLKNLFENPNESVLKWNSLIPA